MKICAPDTYYRTLVEEMPVGLKDFAVIDRVSNDPELIFVNAESH